MTKSAYREAFGFDRPGTYRPRTNAFWYGVVCGICVATSAAMFMIVTRLLGIWT